MKGGQLWQHPFVDVFKYVSISEWRQCAKEGDVTELIDKNIGKKVFKLQGSVSASNYIQIPKSKGEMKSLALNGKFIYMLIRVPPGKLFSIHFDLLVCNTRTNNEEPLKISLSNLFKENKLQNSVQISCKLSTKWTIVCLDIKNVISEYFGEKIVMKETKMITICANLIVRGVYTSDILYNPKTLPKEMALKAVKIEEWHRENDWIHFPEAFGNENMEGVRAENQSPVKTEEIKEKVQNVRKKYVKEENKMKINQERPQRTKPVAKSVHSDVDQAKDQQKVLNTNTNVEEALEKPFLSHKAKSKSLVSTPVMPTKAEKPYRPPPVKPPKPTKNTPLTEPEPIEIHAKALFPDPILELSNILSVSTHKFSIAWVPSDHFSSYPSPFKDNTSKFLLYTSNCTIIALNPVNNLKSFYFAHNAPVTIIQLYKHFLVSGDLNCMILFWPIKSRKKPVPLNMKKLKEITFYEFLGNKMVISGKDELKRDMVFLYDTTNLIKKREILHISQSLSDFDIKVIKFIDETKLLSCGKDAIRYWVLKDTYLSNTSVYIPSSDFYPFTDLMITDKKAYIASNKGTVHILNLTTKDLEASFPLHKGEISRIKIVEDIIITSGKDSYTKLWPLDFHELYMEVQHKSPVKTIDLLGNNAVTLTENGVLVNIDLQNSTFTTLLKNYAGCVDFDVGNKNITVISNVVHVLGKDTMPICEFSSAEDDPIAVAVGKETEVVCLGFYSGAVRVFDVKSLRVVDEFTHLKAPIEVVKVSNDGKTMVCIAEDGNYSIFDGNMNFQPVKDGKIDVPCAFCVSFSKKSDYLAFITSYSTCISVFTISPLAQKFKINNNSCFSHIEFSAKTLLALSQNPCKMTYYTLNEQKISMVKDINLNTNAVKFAISPQSTYIICACEDFSLRVFDFFFTSSCQVFLGHTSEIMKLQWHDENIYSLSGKDGVFIWDFKGDLTELPNLPEEMQESIDEIEGISEESEEPVEIDMEREVEAYLRHVEAIQTNILLSTKPSLKYLIGYSPVPYNLHWVPNKSCMLHTSGSILVKTLLIGDKKQVLLHEHYNPISAVAVSPDCNYIATAEGLANFEGLAKIKIWNLDTCKVYKILEYHDRGVNTISFSPCGNFLCSIGNVDECVLVVWEILLSRVISTSILANRVSHIRWLPELASLEFASLSSNELIHWRLNTLRHLEFQPGDINGENFTCMDYSAYIEDLSSHLLIIGTGGGSILVLNARTNTFIMNKKVGNFPISSIQCKDKFAIVAGKSPEVLMWNMTFGLFVGDGQKVLCDGLPIAISFNNLGSEGIISTSSGSVWYIESDSGNVRVMSSHSKNITAVSAGKYIATSSQDNTIRIWNPLTLEQDTHILIPSSICTCLCLHHSLAYLIAGFEDGTLKAFEIETARCLGSTRSVLTSLSCISFAPDSDSIVLGAATGIIIGVVVLKWSPFTIDFFEFSKLQAEILSLDTKNKLVFASTANGVANVWEKKFTPENAQNGKLFDSAKVEFNLIDNWDLKEPYERTKHVYLQADCLECKGKFDNISEKIIWLIIRGAQYLLARNYYSHQITKKINLAGFPLCISVKDHRISVGLSDRRVLVYSDGNVHEFSAHSDIVTSLDFYENGLVTVASNEIAIWTDF